MRHTSRQEIGESMPRFYRLLARRAKADRWGGRPQRHQCAMVRVVRTCTKEPLAMSITMIGLDTAKSVFQVHAVNATGKTEIKRKLSRNDLLPFFKNQELCTVILEACGAAHHYGQEQRRVMDALGTSGRFAVAIGVGGAGKTTLLRPLVEAWLEQDRPVYGTAT